MNHPGPLPDPRPPTPDPAVRHLTATGFLVHEGRVLLHWHRKNRMWLPLGGHIEENEDPVQAVLREVEEESGIAAALVTYGPRPLTMNQRQLQPPVTILLERVTDGQTWHEHIDLIYFCRPAAGVEGLATNCDPTLRWLSRAELEADEPLTADEEEKPARVPEDVRVLAIEAINATSMTLSFE